MRATWLLGIAVAAALTSVAILISLTVPGDTFGDIPPSLSSEPLPPRGIVTIAVRAGESAKSIGEKLEETSVVRSSRQFESLAALLGYADQLQAGTYDFEPGLSTLQVLERIHGGITSPRTVTIPEGRRLEEVAEILAANGVVGVADFFAALEQPANWSGTLAADRPLGASLEGYLFPATYTFSLRATGDEVARQMLERLDQAFPPDRLFQLNQQGRSVHEVLTLASIVERETLVAEERALIASVFSNRLGEGIRLESDVTVQYAISEIPGSIDRFGYWKRELTLDDLAFPSPYNTYVSAGLPPGPIANPGDASIAAAIDPPPSNLFFFVARGDGSHVFAETFDEHLRNAREFLGLDDQVPIADVGEGDLDDAEAERAP